VVYAVLGNNRQRTQNLFSRLPSETDVVHCFLSTTLISRVIKNYNFNYPNWFRAHQFGSATTSLYAMRVHCVSLPVAACTGFLKKKLRALPKCSKVQAVAAVTKGHAFRFLSMRLGTMVNTPMGPLRYFCEIGRKTLFLKAVLAKHFHCIATVHVVNCRYTTTSADSVYHV